MILLNLKLYPQTFAHQALDFAAMAKSVSQQTGVKIYPVVSALDAVEIHQKLGIEVYLQHVDPFLEGPHSGFISPLHAQSLGIKGSLLNHSEHRLKPGTIKSLLKHWPQNFDSVLCLQTLGQLNSWAKNLNPTFFAYEPKEYIGNSQISVSTGKPQQVQKFAEILGDKKLLIGAGIHQSADVSTGLKLGAVGILVASAVVKASDPQKELMALATAFSV